MASQTDDPGALAELLGVLADIVQIEPVFGDKSFVRYWHFGISAGKYAEGLSSIAEARSLATLRRAKTLQGYWQNR